MQIAIIVLDLLILGLLVASLVLGHRRERRMSLMLSQAATYATMAAGAATTAASHATSAASRSHHD